MFQPKILRPDPDPFFVTELAKIDKRFRIVWGYERYFRSRWVIERRLDPDSYYHHYKSLIESHDDRYVEQAIFDMNQQELDQEGNPVGYKLVGYRLFDLAPEWEWVMTLEEPDGGYRPPDSRTLLQLRREQAWNQNHSLTRLKLEKQAEEEKKALELRKKNQDIVWEGVKDAWRETGKTVQVSQPTQILEGTEL